MANPERTSVSSHLFEGSFNAKTCHQNHQKKTHMNSDQNRGYLLYMGDEILPSYLRIIINHYKDPY